MNNLRFTYTDIQNYVSALWGGARVKILPFAYSIDLGAVADGASVTGNLQIAGDSDFVVTHIDFYPITNGGEDEPAPEQGTVLFESSDTNERWTANAVPVRDYCNLLGMNPLTASLLSTSLFLQLPIPRRIAQASAVDITLNHVDPLGGALTKSIFVLNGVRLREYSQ